MIESSRKFSWLVSGRSDHPACKPCQDMSNHLRTYSEGGRHAGAETLVKPKELNVKCRSSCPARLSKLFWVTATSCPVPLFKSHFLRPPVNSCLGFDEGFVDSGAFSCLLIEFFFPSPSFSSTLPTLNQIQFDKLPNLDSPSTMSVPSSHVALFLLLLVIVSAAGSSSTTFFFLLNKF